MGGQAAAAATLQDEIATSSCEESVMTPDFRLISTFRHRQTSDHLREKELVCYIFGIPFSFLQNWCKISDAGSGLFFSFLQVMSEGLFFLLIIFKDQEKEGSSKI